MLWDLSTYIQESLQELIPPIFSRSSWQYLLWFYKHLAENSKVCLFKELWVDEFYDWYLLTSDEN